MRIRTKVRLVRCDVTQWNRALGSLWAIRISLVLSAESNEFIAIQTHLHATDCQILESKNEHVRLSCGRCKMSSVTSSLGHKQSRKHPAMSGICAISEPILSQVVKDDMEAGRRIVVQRERVASSRLKINGRIDRAREERWDELWGSDTITVAATGRKVVLSGDEL